MKKFTILLLLLAIGKLGNCQQWQWTKNVGNENWGQDVLGITSDVNGNSYITGMATSNVVFDTDTLYNPWFCGFVTKYDTDGKVKWVNRAGNTMYSIASDKKNNICVAGVIGQSFNPTNLFTSKDGRDISVNGRGSFDVGVAKYTPEGNLLWVATAGGKNWDQASDIAVDEEGNSYITGIYKDTAYFGNFMLPHHKIPAMSYKPERFFVAKLDKNGNFVWAHYAYCSNEYSYILASKIHCTKNGEVFVSGHYSNSSDSLMFDEVPVLPVDENGGFVAKYSTNGDLLWINKTPLADNICPITDYEGNCYVGAGTTLIKYDTNGNEIYNQKIIYSAERLQPAIKSMVFDSVSNSIFMTGNFKNYIITFGNAPHSKIVTGTQSTNCFVTKWKLTGELVWITVSDGVPAWGEWTSSTGISNDNAGNLFLTGDFMGGVVNFGDTQFTNTTKGNIFVSKIEDLDVTAVKNDLFSQNSFGVYPNPSFSSFNLKIYLSERDALNLKIMDVNGKCVYSEKLPEFEGDLNKKIDLKLSNGIYFLEITGNKNRYSQKIIKH